VAFPGALDDEAFDRAISAADVTLHLRWPSAVETSGPWLRALAAARPTVTLELAHTTHVPALDPRTWQAWQPWDRADPVTVALDVLDEDHSLRLAMRRLAVDSELRDRIGRRARTYWEQEHTPAHMVRAYQQALAQAASTPAPVDPLPRALAEPATAHTDRLLAPFGEDACISF